MLNYDVDGQEVDKNLRKILSTKVVDRAYFKAGNLFIVLGAVILAFFVAYAVAAGFVFSWYSPVFIGFVVGIVLTVLGVSLSAIGYALCKKACQGKAQGKIRPPLSCSEVCRASEQSNPKPFDVYVSVRGGSYGGATYFSVLFSWIIAISFIVAAGALGYMIGGAGGVAALSLSSFLAPTDVAGYVFGIAVLVLVAAVALDYLREKFLSKDKGSNRVVICGEVDVPSSQMDSSSTGSVDVRQGLASCIDWFSREVSNIQGGDSANDLCFSVYVTPGASTRHSR